MAESVSNPGDAVATQPPQSQASEPPVRWVSVWIALGLLAVAGSIIGYALRQGTGTGLLIPLLSLLVCLVAAGFDAATGRIPNPITYTAILLGLILNSLASLILRSGGPDLSPWIGHAGAGQAFLGFSACAGIGILCLLVAGMGGGDVKLLVAIGSILGFSQANHIFLWTLAIAVPYALVNLIIRGRLNAVLAVAGLQLLQLVYFRRFEPATPPSRSSIPLAVPLTLALFLARVVPQEVVARWLRGV